mmetsp:Transcript_41654/g.47971  ORF Transcript_41654/g.47971 Transcript_41654/m.47971 type:complete len:109 (-) Transcript_41654:63-389(-)
MSTRLRSKLNGLFSDIAELDLCRGRQLKREVYKTGLKKLYFQTCKSLKANPASLDHQLKIAISEAQLLKRQLENNWYQGDGSLYLKFAPVHVRDNRAPFLYKSQLPNF